MRLIIFKLPRWRRLNLPRWRLFRLLAGEWHPPKFAAMLELVDKRVSKTRDVKTSCRFESDSRHIFWRIGNKKGGAILSLPGPEHIRIED